MSKKIKITNKKLRNKAERCYKYLSDLECDILLYKHAYDNPIDYDISLKSERWRRKRLKKIIKLLSQLPPAKAGGLSLLLS